MNELDEAIRKTLSREDAKLLERFGTDPSLHRQVLETFRGESKWLHAIGWIAGLALFVAGCYFWWRFVYAEEIRHMLLWSGSASLTFLGLALVKIWFWLELQKNSIVREVKRAELQIASLAARLGN